MFYYKSIQIRPAKVENVITVEKEVGQSPLLLFTKTGGIYRHFIHQGSCDFNLIYYFVLQVY